MNQLSPASAIVPGSGLSPPPLLLSSSPTADAFLPGLALALAIGLLIGVERGWALRDEPAGERVAGVRTFSLLGLFGGWLGLMVGDEAFLPATLLAGGAAAAVLLGYAVDMRRSGNVSATSAVAALLTLALGATAARGHYALASVCGGAAVLLLASRGALHAALERTSEAELKALMRLVLVVFVILPLLPDVGLGPFGLNPRRLWLVVVTCGAISMVGYGLSRWLGGHRGTLITAAVGALVSSTAVTLDAARRIRDAGASPAQDAAVALAQAVMMARALLLVALLAPAVLPNLAALVLPGLVPSALIAAALYWRSRAGADGLEPRPVRPPGLGLALLFAATVAVVSTLAGWTEQRFGSDSAAIVIAVGGLADIDSAIASLATLPEGTIPARIAGYAIATPVLFNSLLKLVMLLAVGGLRPTLLGAGTLAIAATAMVAAAAVEAI